MIYVLFLVPELQGRVMTSSAKGNNGQSFGWINHEFIAEGKQVQHMNPYGGEERFWMGPEGGQFSIYFKPETTFEFENWFVPKTLDTEPFNLVQSTENTANFEKRMALINHSGTSFDLKVNRKIRLINKEKAKVALGIDFPSMVAMVGFESENEVTNLGRKHLG